MSRCRRPTGCWSGCSTCTGNDKYTSRLSATIWRYRYLRGHRLRRRDPAAGVEVLISLGGNSLPMDDPGRARDHLRQALAISDETGL
ncbi:hypothetical protein [Actinocrispum wychmicini]|uniref:hypothetical protein n=1 Tax=Actinocrispum wychmicini TaxID=1213861 RepID=UPI001048BDB5|nr:hypothetical protein [Actinocrispum wychmicini]